MIGYTTVGTNNIQQATAFYEALFSLLGVNKLYDAGVFVAWGQNQEQPMFCLTQPYDGKPATVGNGTMIALRAS